MIPKIDIHDRIFRFVIEGLRLIKFFPNNEVTRVLIYQYVKAITSVGANDNEADGTSTSNDFIHIYTVVRKELKETRYWLRVVEAIYPLLNSKIAPVCNESEEIIKIVSKIINNTKRNRK